MEAPLQELLPTGPVFRLHEKSKTWNPSPLQATSPTKARLDSQVANPLHEPAPTLPLFSLQAYSELQEPSPMGAVLSKHVLFGINRLISVVQEPSPTPA